MARARTRTTAAEYRSLLVDDEGDIQRRVLLACLDMGVEAWRTNSGAMRGGKLRLAPAGTPDVLGYLPARATRPGLLFGIEVKRPGETMSTSQVAWHAKASAAGVACCCVDNVRDAIAFLQREIAR